jgi:hypothetical protein
MELGVDWTLKKKNQLKGWIKVRHYGKFYPCICGLNILTLIFSVHSTSIIWLNSTHNPRVLFGIIFIGEFNVQK